MSRIGKRNQRASVVEHGLEQTAVISFFKHPCRYTDLTVTETQQVLAISYNNLVDWHIQVIPRSSLRIQSHKAASYCRKIPIFSSRSRQVAQ